MMWFIMDCGTETVTMLHTFGLLWLFSAVSDYDNIVNMFDNNIDNIFVPFQPLFLLRKGRVKLP